MGLITYLIRRIALSVLGLFVLVTLVFFLMKLIPGDPARFRAGPGATREQVEKARQELGLDKPNIVQYLSYLENLLHGDLGRSVISNRPVAEDIKDRLPATLELTLAAFIIGAVIGFPLATFAAVRPNSVVDNLARTVGVVGIAIPTFWFGLLLILVFYRYLKLLPAGGRVSLGASVSTKSGFLLFESLIRGEWRLAWDAFKHIILPAVCLSPGFTAPIVRVFRASLLEVLNQDYIRTAHSKGLPVRVVIIRHAYRNALVPTLVLVGNVFGILAGNAILTEVVFYWPGIGSYALNAISALDYTAAMGAVLVIGMVVFGVNLTVDITQVALDPTLRDV